MLASLMECLSLFVVFLSQQYCLVFSMKRTTDYYHCFRHQRSWVLREPLGYSLVLFVFFSPFVFVQNYWHCLVGFESLQIHSCLNCSFDQVKIDFDFQNRNLNAEDYQVKDFHSWQFIVVKFVLLNHDRAIHQRKTWLLSLESLMSCSFGVSLTLI